MTDPMSAAALASLALAIGAVRPAVPRLDQLRPARDVAASPPSGRGPALVLLATVALALIVPPAALGLVLWWWARPRLAARRAAERTDRELHDSLPDVVDLLALCRSAGWSVPLSVPLVAARSTGPVPAALGRAADLAARGVPLADALLGALSPLGDRARALGHLLADHLRYGSPLGPGLDRLSLELRLHRRRQAERRARQVPVRLLLPLVSCTLPAFALLTVVPLLVGSLRSLSV